MNWWTFLNVSTDHRTTNLVLDFWIRASLWNRQDTPVVKPPCRFHYLGIIIVAYLIKSHIPFGRQRFTLLQLISAKILKVAHISKTKIGKMVPILMLNEVCSSNAMRKFVPFGLSDLVILIHRQFGSHGLTFYENFWFCAINQPGTLM